MNYTVYEVFPDGRKFFRFESDSQFGCQVYVRNHWYDHKHSTLVIEESEELRRIKAEAEYNLFEKEKKREKIKHVLGIILACSVGALWIFLSFEVLGQLWGII